MILTNEKARLSEEQVTSTGSTSLEGRTRYPTGICDITSWESGWADNPDKPEDTAVEQLGGEVPKSLFVRKIIFLPKSEGNGVIVVQHPSPETLPAPNWTTIKAYPLPVRPQSAFSLGGGGTSGIGGSQQVRTSE